MQYENIGKFIKSMRRQIKPNLSLNQFAFDNNIEPAILSRIENQKQDIKWKVLVKIAQGLDMPVSEFIKLYENTCVD